MRMNDFATKEKKKKNSNLKCIDVACQLIQFHWVKANQQTINTEILIPAHSQPKISQPKQKATLKRQIWIYR